MPRRKARSFFPVVFTFIPAIRAWQSLIMALIISNWRIQDPKIPVDRFHPLPETFCTPCTFNPVSRSRCTWCDWMLSWLAPHTTGWTRAEFLIILQWCALCQLGLLFQNLRYALCRPLRLVPWTIPIPSARVPRTSLRTNNKNEKSHMRVAHKLMPYACGNE